MTKVAQAILRLNQGQILLTIRAGYYLIDLSNVQFHSISPLTNPQTGFTYIAFTLLSVISSRLIKNVDTTTQNSAMTRLTSGD
jgi:hypothetical protein